MVQWKYLTVRRCQFHQHFTRAFCANILGPKNFKLKTQLCNFWRQNISAKCSRKMLMKSTQGCYSTQMLNLIPPPMGTFLKAVFSSTNFKMFISPMVKICETEYESWIIVNNCPKSFLIEQNCYIKTDQLLQYIYFSRSLNHALRQLLRSLFL